MEKKLIEVEQFQKNVTQTLVQRMQRLRLSKTLLVRVQSVSQTHMYFVDNPIMKPRLWLIWSIWRMHKNQYETVEMMH